MPTNRPTTILGAHVAHNQPFKHWLMHMFAALTLIPMIAALLVIWPVPQLGISIDAVSGTVLSLDPDSVAERAGVTAGDRVLGIYDYAWQDADRQPFLYPLAWQTVPTIPLRTERAGVALTYALAAEPPSLDFQIEKLVAFLLGLICWLAGYLIGIVRRHEPAGALMVAWFWMGLGAIVGCYTFAIYSSYPLLLALRWLLLSVIAPLSIAMHIHFPMRKVPDALVQRARQWLIRTLVVLQGSLIGGMLIFRPTDSVLIDLLGTLLPIVFALTFLASGIVLWLAYTHTTIAHVQRQIRLLGTACGFIACCWLGLRTIPVILNIPTLLPDYVIDAISVLLPLAYLTSSITPDLYRIDRIALKFIIHALTSSSLLGILLVLTQLINLSAPMQAAWLAVCIVVLYRPLLTIVRWLRPFRTRTQSRYQPLEVAASQIAATLDTHVVIETVARGLQTTFEQPALGFYMHAPDGSSELRLCFHDRMNLPDALPIGPLTDYLIASRKPVESRTIYTALSAQADNEQTHAMLQHPGVAIWCPLLHAHGHLVGVVLLGMRSSLDPYRADDLQEIRRFLETAALAFTNSTAYLDSIQSEQTIRRLLQRVRQVQDTTAAAIAREIHDEAININLRLTMEAIRRLMATASEPALHKKLVSLLESEQTLADLLRSICERLQPLTDGDPYGLPLALQNQVDRVAAFWNGTCQLLLPESRQPVALATQWEAFRITREALNNALKHAAATEIIVELCYPATHPGMVQLSIRDNGRGLDAARVHAGGLGVRNMIESARAVAGTLEFLHPEEGGTAVVFTFATMHEEDDREATPTTRWARESAQALILGA